MPYVHNDDGVMVWQDSEWLEGVKRDMCENPEAHAAHMRLNGECPWCGAVDQASIDPSMAVCEAHGNPDCGLCE